MANPLEIIKKGIAALNPIKPKPQKPKGELEQGASAIKGQTEKQKTLNELMKD